MPPPPLFSQLKNDSAIYCECTKIQNSFFFLFFMLIIFYIFILYIHGVYQVLIHLQHIYGYIIFKTAFTMFLISFIYLFNERTKCSKIYFKQLNAALTYCSLIEL